MGRLEGRNLVPSAPQYDASKNFRKLRITWGWVPWEEAIGVVDHFATPFPAKGPTEKPLEKPLGPGLEPPPAPPAQQPATR
jgi:outer membrane protein